MPSPKSGVAQLVEPHSQRLAESRADPSAARTPTSIAPTAAPQVRHAELESSRARSTTAHDFVR